MSQAILTKTLPLTATRTKPTILAKCYAGSLIVHFEGVATHIEDDHHEAARQLATKLGWLGDPAKLHSGSLPTKPTTWAHVIEDEKR